jgi:hypothetical protein
VNGESASSLRKEAIWRLLRLAKLELDSGNLAMASRLLADAADLVEYTPEADFSAPPSNGADPSAARE